MTDALTAGLLALRATAQAQVAQCDALIAGLRESIQDAVEMPEGGPQRKCPACGETKYQDDGGGGLIVCGACNANHKDGEVVP